jgi:RNA polymerase-binding transcription factor DksA
MRIIQQSRNEQASDDTDGDLSDRASLEADRELDQLVSTRESDAVAAIDAALRVMANSPAEYGMCRVCHEPIARERLDVLPWALTCERHADSN